MTSIIQKMRLGMLLPLLVLLGMLPECLNAQNLYAGNDSPVLRKTDDQTQAKMLETVPLKNVLKQLHQRYQWQFAYNDAIEGLHVSENILQEKRGYIISALSKLLKEQGFSLTVIGDRQYGIIRSSSQGAINTIKKATKNNFQEHVKVNGTVKDQSGNPLVGVTVKVKGGTIGTITDAQGQFNLEVPDSAVLEVSYVGYTPQEIPINGKTTFNISLVATATSLNQLMVIGYGVQKKDQITGSIATLQAKQLEDQPVGEIGQRIQGRMAGVEIIQSTGKPGVGMAIRIRGAASLNASNTPLYVVDGIPIVGDISDINPDEIESYTVLKGPAAAAIYGSRASSGVVLITTKTAKTGKAVITFNAYHGSATVPQRGKPDMMNAEEFAEFEKEIFEDKATYEGYTGGVPAIYQNPAQYAGKSTNWYDVILRTAQINSYNLSFSGGTGKLSSAIEAGYYKQEGVMLNTGYQRYSLRDNNKFKVNDFITVGLDLAPTFQTGQNFNSDGSFNIVYAAITTPPIFSPFEKNADGSLKQSFSGPGLFTQPNWYVTLKDRTNRSNITRILSNAYAEVAFLKDFKFKSTISIDMGNSTNMVFNPTNTGTAFGPPPQTTATGSYGTSFYYSWVTENTLNFNKTVAENHHIEVLAGYSAQKFSQESSSLNGSQYPDNTVPWIAAAALTSGSSNISQWTLLSMYSRLNYNFKEKYLLSATLRRDGSSRFGINKQWGSFPSVSAGWVVSDEAFARRWRVLDFLKIRGEYGRTGNFNIGNYTQYANMGTSNYVLGNQLVSGLSPTSLGNTELTWETNSGGDVGLDMRLFNNRVSLTFDYFQNRTKGLLYQQDIPAGTGFTSIQSNIGRFKFWGYEFSGSSKNLTGSFQWNTDFNISFYRNLVLQLGTNNTPIGGIIEQGGFQKTVVGKPMGIFWGWVFDGIYMTQKEFDSEPHYATSEVGTVRMKDLNHDDTITDADRTFLGNPEPKFVFGMNNSFSYKNFDLDIVVSGAYGGHLFNYEPAWTEVLEGLFNVEKALQYRWRSPENPGKGIIGRTLTGHDDFGRFDNSRFVFDDSYLTIKNITLGYTFPLNNKTLKSIRAYLSAQQVWTLTNYPGNNPEVSISGLSGGYGVDEASYPVPRTIAVGMTLKF